MRKPEGHSCVSLLHSIPAAAAAAVLAYAHSITARPRDSVALGAAYVMSSRHIPLSPRPEPRPTRPLASASWLPSPIQASAFVSSRHRPLVSSRPVWSRLVGILKFVLVTTPPPPPLARSSLKLRLQPKSSSYSVNQGTNTPQLIIRLAVPLGSGVGHYHILNWKLNSNFRLESKQASCPS
ncbi:hypothetical protein B0H14DRAFT_2711452, partial [Mycena olivaceomarginata]